MKKEIEQLKENGFVVIKDVVTEELLDAVLENNNRIQESFTGKHFEESKPWETEAFHQHLIEFRKKNPKAFGSYFDTLGTSVSLCQLLTSKKIVDWVAKLLEVMPEELSMSQHFQRVDAPKDTRNLLGWHQEDGYGKSIGDYPTNESGLNGMTVWMPLMDVKEENVALHIAIGSHKEPIVVAKEIQKSGMHSKLIKVPDEIVSKYDQVRAPLDRGYAVFFYNSFIHKSGENTSNRIRFSAVNRFHLASVSDFNPFKNTVTFQKRVEVGE